MLIALIKANFEALYSSLFRFTKQQKKRSFAFKLLIGVFAVYVIGCFFFMFGQMFNSICQPLVQFGLGWLYFAMAAIMATALCFIGSVFTAQQQLFSAKDNDLLFAMPIPPSYILVARMLILLLLNYLFEVLIIAPAGIVYCMHFAPSAIGVILIVACALFLPFLPMTLSCIFGWVLAEITDRMRNKSLVATVFSLCFLAAYFYVFSNLNNYLAAMLQNGAEIGEAVKATMYPAYAFGAAIANGSFVQFGVFLLCCLAPFGLACVILSYNFTRIATSNRGAAKIKYREQKLKVGSASSALLRKELKHFGSNGMVIMNCALGSAFTLVGAVALIIYRDMPQTITAALPMIKPYIGPAAVAALGMLSATNFISAPSVSLEGKNLWIAKSLPVSGYEILMAKVNLHIVITLPPIILASMSAIYVLKAAPLMALDILIVPALLTVFSAMLGVIVNLHFPKFDYVNEVAVVKQSISSLISMFASMGAVILPAALYAFLLKDVISGDIFLIIIAAVFAAVCFIMHSYLRNGGATRFEEL